MAELISHLFAQSQQLMHGSGCTVVIPGILLTAACVLLAYRQLTEEKHHLPLSGFLANILLQMLPLIALKVKIWRCPDRVSLVPHVLVKTLLMHVALEIFRVSSQIMQNMPYGKACVAFDVACAVAGLAILHWVFEFPFTFSSIKEHRDVRNLVAMALAAAFAVESFFVFYQPEWMADATRAYIADGVLVSKTFFVAANYIDIVAFMPAVWRLYQAEGDLEDCSAGTLVGADARRQVQFFFAFLFGFYLWDDVIDPIQDLTDEPLAMAAHGAHFVLLLDFAGFFLFQVKNPPGIQERSEQLQGLLEPDD